MKRHLHTLLVLLCVASPASAHEFLQGGWLCNPSVPYSACNVIREREAAGPLRLDGWYRSAHTLLVGSPKACIVPGSDTQFLFHAISVGPEHGPFGPWSNISHGNAEYARWMQRSPWGRRVYAYVSAQGWLDTPEFHTLTGEQLIALGVPVCK